MDLSEIKALTFDVGGTVLDWHTGMTAHLRKLGDQRGISADWPALTNAWRMKAAMTVINRKTSELPKGNIDGVNRVVLDEILETFNIDALSEEDKDQMTQLWHHIPAWPDASEGLSRLKKKYIVSTLTILSVPLIVHNSRSASLQWDCVISCEMLPEYKFHSSAYSRAAELLGCEPAEVLMVAAHGSDLEAAANVGFRTAYVDRPDEYGDDQKMNRESAQVDLVSPDIRAVCLKDLATQLGT